MAYTLQSPEQLLRGKAIFPSNLRTREWSGVGMPWAADANGVRTMTWIRERAFYMAGEVNINRLVEFRKRIADVLSGRLSEGQARDEIRKFLDRIRYQAPEGLRGTIKDLYTANRLNATIRTNADMCRGYVQHQRLAGNDDYPAMELRRRRRSREPRPWADIWAAAGGRVYQGRRIALVGDPIWLKISDFGNEYPPYKWGSGMWAYPVSREDCVALGVIGPEDYPDTGTPPASLNSNLEKTYPSGVDRRLLEAAAEAMRGFAEVKPVEGGYSLMFTDPNGSRPYGWRDVGRVITGDLPEGYVHYQASAFRDWVADSDRFVTGGGSGHSASLNEREDLIRLFERIEPVGSSEGTVYRALSWTDKNDMEDTLASIKQSGYGARPGYIAESWTASRQAAAQYAGKGDYQIILRCDDYRSRRRIDGIYKHVPSEQQTPHAPVAREGESIFLNGTRFKVTGTRKQKNAKGGTTVYVDVREIR